MIKTGFFEETPGEFSITRLAFAVIIVYSLVMGAIVWDSTKKSTDFITVFSTVAGVATALKLGQKWEEVKSEKNEIDNKNLQ